MLNTEYQLMCIIDRSRPAAYIEWYVTDATGRQTLLHAPMSVASYDVDETVSTCLRDYAPVIVLERNLEIHADIMW